jgi:hypothetical protein
MSISLTVYRGHWTGTSTSLDITPWVDIRTIKITDGFAANSDTLACTFTIPFEDLVSGACWKPQAGNVIACTINSTLEFKGVITEVSDTQITPTDLELQISASDFTFFLDRKKVTKQEYPEQALNARLADMLSEFAPDFTMNNVACSIVIPTEGYDYQELSAILDKWANGLGYVWWVDFDKDIHFVAESTNTSPLTANTLDLDDDSETSVGDIACAEDVSDLANVIIVKDFVTKSDNSFEYPQTGDGESSFFKLPLEPWGLDDLTVSVDGQPYTILTDPLDGAQENITGSPGTCYLCHAPGARVLMGDHTYKPIEGICAGDEVIDATGQPAQVTHVMQRPYRGEMVRLGWHGDFETATMTPEHRLYVVRRERADKRDPRRLHKRDRLFPAPTPEMIEIVKAEEIRPGDFLVMPVLREPANIRLTPEEARLVGYYLAEGHTNDYSVHLSFHANETALHEDAIALAERYFGAKCSIHRDHTNGVCLYLGSRKLADLVKEFGRGSYGKRLPKWVLGLPEEARIELFRGYWSGDGFETQGKLAFDTVCYDLAQDMRRLLESLGVASLLDEHHRDVTLPQGAVYQNHRIYRVKITGQHAARLYDLLGLQKPNRAWRVKRLLCDGQYTYRAVTNVERFVADTAVHNLTVEPQHNYIVYNIMSSNCVLNWGVRFPTSDIPGNGSDIQIDYDFASPPIAAPFFDHDSIRLMAWREGTDGEHHSVYSLPDFRVNDLGAIEAYARMMLGIYAWPRLSGSFATFESGWAAGQSFLLVSEDRQLCDYRAFVQNNFAYTSASPLRVYVSKVVKTVTGALDDSGNAVIRYEVSFSNRKRS